MIEHWENRNPVDIDGEEWKFISGYGDAYAVSNFGRIKSFYYNAGGRGLKLRKTPKILALQKHCKTGYIIVRLNSGITGKTLRVHRMVAIAFLPNPLNLPEVNHSKGIKTDNRASELYWCDRFHNIQHAFSIGLFPKIVGQQQTSTKLKDNEVIEIYRDTKLSARALGRKYGVVHNTIMRIKNKEGWTHITNTLV